MKGTWRAPLVATALLAAVERAEAGPWPAGKGHIYGNVADEFLETTELATPEGVTETIPAYRLQQIGVYGAYGLTDGLTAILDPLGFRESSIAEFESASGIEDLHAGLQVQIGKKGPWRFAARGIMQAPILLVEPQARTDGGGNDHQKRRRRGQGRG